jgi:hypothetical protein
MASRTIIARAAWRRHESVSSKLTIRSANSSGTLGSMIGRGLRLELVIAHVAESPAPADDKLAALGDLLAGLRTSVRK